MRCAKCASPIKKTPGYQERDPQARQSFCQVREALGQAGKELIYVDECGFAEQVTRRYGYAAQGAHVPGLCAGERGTRTSLLAARMKDSLQATLLFEGTCDTQVFNGWVKQMLCPHLTSNHVVVLDNATFHKSATTRELIEATGAAVLFLPTYSPDLNPIEQDFAVLKKRREYQAHKSLDEIIKAYK